MRHNILFAFLALCCSAYANNKTLIYSEYTIQNQKNILTDSDSKDGLRERILSIIPSEKAKMSFHASFSLSNKTISTNEFLHVVPYLQPIDNQKYTIKKDKQAGLVFESYASFDNNGMTILTLKTWRHESRREAFTEVTDWDVGNPKITVYTELDLDHQAYIDGQKNIIYTDSDGNNLHVITMQIIDDSHKNTEDVKRIRIK